MNQPLFDLQGGSHPHDWFRFPKFRRPPELCSSGELPRHLLLYAATYHILDFGLHQRNQSKVRQTMLIPLGFAVVRALEGDPAVTAQETTPTTRWGPYALSSSSTATCLVPRARLGLGSIKTSYEPLPLGPCTRSLNSPTRDKVRLYCHSSSAHDDWLETEQRNPLIL